MKNCYKLSLAAIAASISLVGCGSGSDSTSAVEKVTGQFVDTYVSGLNYTCSSGTTGITNNMGEYTCNVGDTVEFSLGGYLLGSVTASSGIVTPEALYPDNPEAALNVAQVIQSLDTDPTDDIITIPENFSDLDDVTVTPEDTNFDALIEDELDVPLVTEEEAQEHLDETELMLLLGGKTFYGAAADYVDEVVINADVTSLTWTTIGGPEIGETETEALEIDGNTVVATDNGNYLMITEETNDYLLINMYQADGTSDGADRWYFDQAKAEAYYASLQPDLETLFVGQTKYFANSKGGTGYRSYAADGTYTGSVSLAPDATAVDVSGTYNIIGDVITITRTSQDPNVIVELTYVSNIDSIITMSITVNGGTPFETREFNTEAERDAYVASLQPDLETLFVGQTKYFANSKGGTGYRSYAADGTYTGSVSLAPDATAVDVSGTYNIVGDMITITRTSQDPNVIVELTYVSNIDGIITMSITVNGGIPFETREFDTEAERDAYVAALLPDLETLLVGNTFYQPVQDISQTPTAEWIAESTFNANGTVVVVDDGNPETMTYTIDGITLTRDGTKVSTLTNLTDTYIEFDSSIDGTWYFTLEAAEAAPPVIWE